MKANELMIEDWVMTPHNYPSRVQIVNDRGCLPFKDERIVGWVKYFKLEEVEPIPLTPEILEKNGFTDWADHSRTTRSCSLLVDKTNIIVQKIDGTDYIFTQIHRGGAGSCEFRMDLKYVHELQHALRLCRIEKEIVL